MFSFFSIFPFIFLTNFAVCVGVKVRKIKIQREKNAIKGRLSEEVPRAREKEKEEKGIANGYFSFQLVFVVFLSFSVLVQFESFVLGEK